MEELKKFSDYLSFNVIAERIANELFESGVFTQHQYELVRISEENDRTGFQKLLDVVQGKQDCVEMSYSIWKFIRMLFPRASANCPVINEGLRFETRTGQIDDIVVRLADYDFRPCVDIRRYQVSFL